MTDEEITNTDENHTTDTTTEQNQARARAAARSDHYAEQTTVEQDDQPRTKRSRARTRASHRGITIRWCGPASGRPGTRLSTHHLALDLAGDAYVILGGWSGC